MIECLFRQSIDNHKDGSEAFRRRKLLNEAHGYGVPWFLRYRELFQESEWTVLGCLGTGTGCARTDVVLDEGADAWPGIFPTDEFQGSVLPEVASCRVIVEGSENSEAEIVSFGDEDTVVP